MRYNAVGKSTVWSCKICQNKENTWEPSMRSTRKGVRPSSSGSQRWFSILVYLAGMWCTRNIKLHQNQWEWDQFLVNGTKLKVVTNPLTSINTGRRSCWELFLKFKTMTICFPSESGKQLPNPWILKGTSYLINLISGRHGVFVKNAPKLFSVILSVPMN